MTLYYDIFETTLGWMGLLASEEGLRRSTLPMGSPDECVEDLGEEVDWAIPAPERFTGLKEKLELYFEGGAVSFEDEPIDVHDAAPFHRAAWDTCRSIPLGETRSYGWLGINAGGSLGAARAAGQSMARNRIAIIIPCHRVIAADGTLGGYGSGRSRLPLKQQLLDLETRATR